MKSIMLVALLASSLAAVGCSKKSGADCEAPINKGMDNFLNMLKSKGSNMPSAPMQAQLLEKARGVFIGHCQDDKWAPEVAECFATVQSQHDVVKCEGKLTEDQRSKLHVALRESRSGMATKMPNIPGHPQYLQGTSPMSGSSGAPSDGSGAAPASGSGAAPAAAGSGAAPAAGSAAPAGGW